MPPSLNAANCCRNASKRGAGSVVLREDHLVVIDDRRRHEATQLIEASFVQRGEQLRHDLLVPCLLIHASFPSVDLARRCSLGPGWASAQGATLRRRAETRWRRAVPKLVLDVIPGTDAHPGTAGSVQDVFEGSDGHPGVVILSHGQQLLQLARAGAFTVVGVALFVVPASVAGRTWVILGAYIVAGAALAWWSWLEHKPQPHRIQGTALAVALGVMAVVAAAGTPIPFGGALFCLAVMAAVAAGSELQPRLSAVVVGVGVTAFEVVAALTDADAVSRLGLPLLLVVAGLAGYNRREYRLRSEQSTTLLAQAIQMHDAERRVAVLDERSRLAREIHDVLAHSLGGLSVQVQAAQAVLVDTGDVARAVVMLRQAQQLAASELQDTRRAVHLLRADPQPLSREIDLLGASHRSRYDALVNVHLTGRPFALSAEGTVALLRTTQEALLNAAKHAPGQPVNIDLDYGVGQVTLVISNEVAPTTLVVEAVTPTTVDGGFGLIGIRERMLLQRGNLSVRRSADRWTVTAKVPA